jgi:hypothetical protein
VKTLLVKGLYHSNLPSTLELVCDVPSLLHALPQDINYDPNRSSVGVEWLGVCARGLLLCRRISPCLRPSLKDVTDVRNYDTPIREQQAAVTVRYTRADQQAAVAVEPLRL